METSADSHLSFLCLWIRMPGTVSQCRIMINCSEIQWYQNVVIQVGHPTALEVPRSANAVHGVRCARSMMCTSMWNQSILSNTVNRLLDFLPIFRPNSPVRFVIIKRCSIVQTQVATQRCCESVGGGWEVLERRAAAAAVAAAVKIYENLWGWWQVR